MMRISLAVVTVLLFVGCKSKQEGALESFVKAHSCPESRVTVRERPDLSWLDVIGGNATPPDDIAADPGRLAQWTKDREATRSSAEQIEVFHVEGCDRRDYVGCTNPDSYRLGRRTKNLAEVSCMHHSIDQVEEKATKTAAKRDKLAEKDKKREEREAEREERRREREQRLED